MVLASLKWLVTCLLAAVDYVPLTSAINQAVLVTVHRGLKKLVT